MTRDPRPITPLPFELEQAPDASPLCDFLISLDTLEGEDEKRTTKHSKWWQPFGRKSGNEDSRYQGYSPTANLKAKTADLVQLGLKQLVPFPNVSAIIGNRHPQRP